MAIEQAAYKVILKEGEFEIRQYEPMIVAVSQELDLRGGGGFDTLFAYINGNNEDKKKINMTTHCGRTSERMFAVDMTAWIGWYSVHSLKV